jgi:hypothetical protein
MRRKVEHLEAALTRELNTTGEGASIVRGLINQIRLHPRQRREAMPIEVYGEPNALFLSARGDTPKPVDRLITVVAEEGLEPPTRGSFIRHPVKNTILDNGLCCLSRSCCRRDLNYPVGP